MKTSAKAVSFRLKEGILEKLRQLAGRWECSQTAAVERAIEELHDTWVPKGDKIPRAKETVAGGQNGRTSN